MWLITATLIREISLNNDRVTTLIHNVARFGHVYGMVLDEKNKCLFTTEGDSPVIRKVDMSGKEVIV